MKKLSKQKKWIFVPFANLIIIYISLLRNVRAYKGMWQFKLFAYVAAGVLPLFAISMILSKLGMYNDVLNCIMFYADSIVISIIMIYWQKKNGIE